MNAWAATFEWSRRVGGNPSGGENEVSLLRAIASARGATTVGYMNRTDALRSIATSYGKAAGDFNTLQSLRSIVDVIAATPAGRNLGDMNELDCLRAIVGNESLEPFVPFSPADIESAALGLWLKPANWTAASWPDLSGAGNDHVQATGGSQATLVPDAVNGYDAIRFDGIDDVMTGPSLTLGHVFVLARYHGGPLLLNLNGIFTHGILPTIALETTTYVYTGAWDAGSNRFIDGEQSLNASPIDEFRLYEVSLDTPLAGTSWIGSERGNAGRYGRWEILEIVGYAAKLPDVDRARVRTYLMEKIAYTAEDLFSLPLGLVGYWPLSEGSGATTAEEAAALADATITIGSGAWSALGRVGNGLSFNGTTLDVGASANLTTADFSIGFWMKCGVQASAVGLFDKSNGSTQGFYARLNVDGTITCIGYNSAWSSTMASSELADGKWHHVMIVRDQFFPGVRIYQDGVDRVSAGGSVVAYTPSANSLQFGVRRDVAQPFVGIMDEIGYWDRRLRTWEIRKLVREQRPTLPGNAFLNTEAAKWTIDPVANLVHTEVWEDNTLQEACVMQLASGSFVMAYTGGFTTPGIAWATSPTGLAGSWTKRGRIVGGGIGGTATGFAARSELVLDGSTLYLYFSDVVDTIWRLETTNWTIAGLPTFTNLTEILNPSQCNGDAVGWPGNTTILQEASRWVMILDAQCFPNPLWRAHLTFSTDHGLTWTDPVELTGLQIGQGYVWGGAQLKEINGRYELYLHAGVVTASVPNDIYRAMSYNLTDWLYVRGAIIDRADGTLHDIEIVDQVADPNVHTLANGTSAMWFEQFNNTDSKAQIMRATASEAVSQIVALP